MNKILFACLLGLAVASAAVFKEEEYQHLFTKFMQQYQKKYTHDTFFYRYQIFKQNMDKIALANKQNHTYTLCMNAMGDMTHAEFKAAKLGYKRTDRSVLRSKNTHGPHVHAKIAATVDWRTKDAVTPVKDQGQCGSCWAFSTTGSVEGAVAIAGDKTAVGLSEQQLVDCSSAQGNQGCDGGLMDQAFQYIISNKGIASEAAYPYTAQDGTCKTGAKSVAKISSFVDVTGGDENALAKAVNIGPVSVAIEADQACFQFYSGGVLTDPSCGTQLDHGVLAVGYGTYSGQDYWIVKNSWGQSWGIESGYVWIAKGDNECGIATENSYPVV